MDPIFSPSDYSYVMNDLKDCPLEDVSVGQLLGPLEAYSSQGNDAYEESDQSEVKPLVRKRKSTNTKMCDSTMKPSTSNIENLPCLAEYPGTFNFQLYLPSDVSAHRWTFSKQLNKVFIDIEKVLALQFKWNYFDLKPDVQFFVRALPVYTSPDWMKVPVSRCPLHVLPDNPTNNGFPYVEHIIRCEHSHTRYERDEGSKRLSCVTPLSNPQAGSDTTTLTYKFVCKTSCPSGMDRKPISVLFTLEDINGVVYGRQPLAVKICSCPKRDKLKEETNDQEKKVNTSRVAKSRSTGGSLSVRASKVPNTDNLKDLQCDTETSGTDDRCKMKEQIVKANKKYLGDNAIAKDIKQIKDDVQELLNNSRNDHFQLFANYVAAELKQMPQQQALELQTDIQKAISFRKSFTYDQQMTATNNCLTPAPSISSPGLMNEFIECPRYWTNQ